MIRIQNANDQQLAARAQRQGGNVHAQMQGCCRRTLLTKVGSVHSRHH